jgi:transcriptional regulator with XRE-family HTH domain
MKDRITHFLKNQGISPAEFADKIGVQRSSVSHVLNGRNFPSASFIQKMLGSYKTLNPRWLLMGEGAIFDAKTTPVKEPLLFHIPSIHETLETNVLGIETDNFNPKDVTGQPIKKSAGKRLHDANSNQQAELNSGISKPDLTDYTDNKKELDRIVFFFSDKTFSVYTPSK